MLLLYLSFFLQSNILRVTLFFRVLKNALFSVVFSSALPVLSSLERCYSLPWGQHTYYKPLLVFTLCCRLFKLLLFLWSSIVFAPSPSSTSLLKLIKLWSNSCCIMGTMTLFYDNLSGFVWMAGLSFLNSGKHLKSILEAWWKKGVSMSRTICRVWFKKPSRWWPWQYNQNSTCFLCMLRVQYILKMGRTLIPPL